VLDEVLAIVRSRRGIDFRGYRRDTIERRLLNRMVAARAASPAEYLHGLRASDGETDRLIATLTVKVSRFFRNAAVFDTLRDVVLPDLRARFPHEALRLWSAGCGEGEEAYSLAMLLADTPGDVLGTDIDGSALAAAAAGRYPERTLQELPPVLAAQCTEPAGSGTVAVRDPVRRRVHFAFHDLVAAEEPPGGRPFHLVCCRNVIIYFDPASQHRAMHRLVDGLRPGGVLCLGEAEWEGDFAGVLEPLDRHRKLYRRRAADRSPR
jgi:chemotaxis methyl-accepting protein methylase